MTTTQNTAYVRSSFAEVFGYNPGVRVLGSHLVRRPSEVVFGLLTDDEALLELEEGLVEHRILEEFPNGGHACLKVYETKGKRTRADCRTLVRTPPNRLASMSRTGSGEGITRWTLEPGDVGTIVRLEIEWSSRSGPLRKWWARRRSASSMERLFERLDALLAETDQDAQ